MSNGEIAVQFQHRHRQTAGLGEAQTFDEWVDVPGAFRLAEVDHPSTKLGGVCCHPPPLPDGTRDQEEDRRSIRIAFVFDGSSCRELILAKIDYHSSNTTDGNLDPVTSPLDPKVQLDSSADQARDFTDDDHPAALSVVVVAKSKFDLIRNQERQLGRIQR